MRKFSGKCFSFEVRDEGKIKTSIGLGGLAGFSMARNKISPRSCEGNQGMGSAEVNHWEKAPRSEVSISDRLNQCHEYSYIVSRLDTTHNRRDNDNYNR
jgi:hypothetical protein